MTAIRNNPQPPAVRPATPQAPVVPSKTDPVPGAPVDVPAPRPSSGYALAKQKLVSITGRHRAAGAGAALPGEAMDLKSLLVSLRTGGGAVGAPKAKGVANPNDVQRANEALKAVPAPKADHPRMQHLKDVQAQLKKEGLPTDADGVHVYVVGDSTSPEVDHGAMVTRTIAGPIGLAQGAEVELSERLPDPASAKLEEGERLDHVGANLSVKMGSGTAEELKMWAVDSLEAAYTQPKAELDALVARAPKDGQTKIVNMSWGNSEDALVAQATKAAIGAGNDAPLVKDLNDARKALGKPALDLKKPEAQEELRQFIAGKIHQALTTGDGAQRIRTARSEATQAVARARDAGFLPIAAAGNFHETRTSDGSRTNENLVATIPGVLSVGSVAMGDVKKAGDETMGKSSSPGAAVAAPGVGVPVATDKKTGKLKDVDGTSFAAPYVASVAALMVKANPNITPAELEKILTDPKNATDVKNTTRDGAGVIDPVKAVKAARALMGAADLTADFHTSQDLDPASKRAAHDALRKLMPTTRPAFKEAIKVIQDDHFVELDVKTQQALLGGIGDHPDDAKLGKDVIALAKDKEFLNLGPAARERFARNFAGLEPGDRAEAMKLLEHPDIAKLPAPINDAVTAAASKAPSDAKTIKDLVDRANSKDFKKLPADAQAAFFRAFEHQHETIEIDPQPANKAALLKLVDHPEFKKLSPADQSKWMLALGSDDPAVRKRAFERLADTPMKKADLGSTADALDADQSVRADRKVLPGASTDTPKISAAVEDQRAVFFKEVAPGGMDPKKHDVLVHKVAIDGQTFELVYPRPMPKNVPSPELIAQGIAGLPAAERKHLKEIVVQPAYKDMMQAVSTKGADRVYMGNAAPDTQIDMTAMLSHETGHLVAAHKFEKDPKFQKKWEAAITADDHAVSNYATSKLQEDVAETVALYYQVKGTPDEAAFKRDFPNRYALMKDLLGE